MAGWLADTNVWPGGAVIALEAPPAIGRIVTIDFERRVFDGGYGRSGQVNLTSKKTYSGRGWQEAIVADATNWL